LELGPAALPHIAEALRSTKVRDVRVRLAQVAAHSRAVEALPILRELLDHDAPEIWKTALDGLVILADDAAARPAVTESLAIARQRADATKRDWIVEAAGQVSSWNETGTR
jgi:hypothetical protein